MSRPILVFDMDGVLVDVTDSYRETIAQTVQHFTGRQLTRQEIQEYKNQGGWNDDWKLSHHIVQQAGNPATFDEVKAHFQKLFMGNGQDGLINSVLPAGEVIRRMVEEAEQIITDRLPAISRAR